MHGIYFLFSDNGRNISFLEKKPRDIKVSPTTNYIFVITGAIIPAVDSFPTEKNKTGNGESILSLQMEQTMYIRLVESLTLICAHAGRIIKAACIRY